MSMEALQSRRNSKSVSTMPENLKDQTFDESDAPPKHPLIELPSPGLSSLDYDYIHAFEAQGDSIQHPSGLEYPEPPKVNLDGRTVVHGDNEEGQYAESEKDEGQNLRNARETELLSLYEELDNLSAKRVRARQSRMALKYKREDEVKLRVNLMRHLNSFFANLDHPEAGPIMREYELLQVASEEYLRMENNYREEEDQLEEQEYLVSLSMENLSGPSNKESAQSIQTFPGPRSPSPSPNRAESTRELPGCVMAYLSRIGDERILHERLAELESEWFITMERVAQRNQVDVPLDDDSEEFLLTYDEQRTRIWKDLNNAQMDVNALRSMCANQGHSDIGYGDISLPDEEFVWESPIYPPSLLIYDQLAFPGDSGPTDQDDWSLEHEPETPKRPPRKNSLEIIHQNSIIISSSEVIKKWLLHQLRISSMGIWRLQRSPFWQSLSDEGHDDLYISRAIIEAWVGNKAAQASAPLVTDDEPDTVIAYAKERKEHQSTTELSVTVRPRSQSMPSSPRTSASKVHQRRHSRP